MWRRQRLGLADAGRDGEGADVVGKPALLGRDEIGERRVGPVAPVLARHLLAQRVQHRERRLARSSSANSSMSSPTALAGQKPTTALAVSHFSATMRFSMACASANSFLASAPTTLSSRMRGYLPGSSQVWKNGVQSM